MELRARRGSIQGAGSRHADGNAANLFDGSSCEIARQRPVSDGPPEVGARPRRRGTRVENGACRHADAAMAGFDFCAEESNDQPDRRTLYRLRARGREVHRRQPKEPQVMILQTKNWSKACSKPRLLGVDAVEKGFCAEPLSNVDSR